MAKPSQFTDTRQRDVVLEAQIAHLYQQLPRVLAYSFVVSAALSIMLRDALPENRIIVWFAVMMTVIVVRLLLYFLYRRKREAARARNWARWYVLLAGVSGLVWGSAGVVLFAPGQLELQALILLVLAGMGAASVSALTVYLPAFYAYLPLSMIPAGVMLLLQPDNFHLFMGFFAFIFLLGVLSFGRTIGTALENSLKLRFENLELVTTLERRSRELELASQAKSKFLAAASHDLRQPLHALSLYSELLEKQATDAKTRELAASIGTSVGVLDRLFSALLDISRIDAGVLKPEIETFPVRTLVKRVFNDNLPKARERGLQLSVECGEEFTESDPTLLERILRNLVTNAIRNTPTGNVTIRCRHVAGSLQLSVIDTGIGIPEHQQEYVFEEFTQLGNPERDRNKGLGLGLSIVRRLARLLDHPLYVRSVPGKGSSFTLTLPCHERPPYYFRRPTPDPQPDKELNLTVMVVDDDSDILAGTRQLLESWGCTVHTAASAEAAIRVARGVQRLDALIADLRLPNNQRGTQVVAALRDLFGAQLPALLITGDLESARLQETRAFELELLHKPVKPARLRAWLQKLPST